MLGLFEHMMLAILGSIVMLIVLATLLSILVSGRNREKLSDSDIHDNFSAKSPDHMSVDIKV